MQYDLVIEMFDRIQAEFEEDARQALEAAAKMKNDFYCAIWIKEIGRCQSANIQSGLLDLMTKGEILLPDGSSIAGRGIAWIADSNYQAETEFTHTLVTFDDALRRRFTINLTFDYLSAEEEVEILSHLFAEEIQ